MFLGASSTVTEGTIVKKGAIIGAGVTITPIAFLVVNGGEVTLKHITAYDNAAERVVNLVPEMFDKVTGLINKTKKDTVADAPVVPAE